MLQVLFLTSYALRSKRRLSKSFTAPFIANVTCMRSISFYHRDFLIYDQRENYFSFFYGCSQMICCIVKCACCRGPNNFCVVLVCQRLCQGFFKSNKTFKAKFLFQFLKKKPDIFIYLTLSACYTLWQSSFFSRLLRSRSVVCRQPLIFDFSCAGNSASYVFDQLNNSY